jgi:uncharacterized glyoxalase superfamily protein PhnB
MPRSIVIPELAYPDVQAAASWLCTAFGFTLRLMIGNHRAQLNIEDGGSMVVAQGPEVSMPDHAHSVMVRVENVDAHFEVANANGARILRPPTDYPYGERQYTVADFAGHVWTFSQSIADINPTDWGGTPGQL